MGLTVSRDLSDAILGFLREVSFDAVLGLYECISDFFNESFSSIRKKRKLHFILSNIGVMKSVCLVKYGVTLWSMGFQQLLAN